MYYSDYSNNSSIRTVVHVCQFLKHGSGKGTVQLVKTLKSMGFDQILILPYPVKGLGHGDSEIEEIWKLGVPTHWVHSTFVRECWTAQSLQNCLNDLVIDDDVAIITHGGFSANVVSSADFQFTHYCHGFGLGRPYWVNEQDRRGISKAYRVLVASKNIASQCIDLGVPASIIATHYYPLELNFKDVQEPNYDGKINLGQVGNFVALKGHVYSLDALRTILTFNTFNKDRFRLHFFGMGPLEGTIKEKVVNMGLNDNVLFHGHCSRDEVFSSIDIMLLPSIVEGLGMVNVEATECGIPICAFDVGGVGEIIEHGKTGLLSKVKDSFSMAGNVISLVENPSFALKLVQEAQRKILNMFDIPSEGALIKSSLIPARRH